MADIFLKLVNMSISASWLVLAVLLLRLLLKKAPKWITVLLWGIVAVRLICPVSFESVLSLIPSTETISPEIMTDQTPQINTGIPVIDDTANPVINDSFAPEPSASANPLQILIPIAAYVWLLGVAALLVYTAVSYLRLRRKVSTAVLLRDRIFQSEAVVSPFVLGIVKPKIYLPFSMAQQDMAHVIAYEQAHLRRKDHLWKPLGFLLLALHWFNPLIWVGYVLLCRDIELACDEKVVKYLPYTQKADYAQTLLTCSVNRRMISACPLAFGEVGVKNRVKSVLSYKKPAFWLILTAVLASIAAALCFLTDPIALNKDALLLGVLDNEKTFISEAGEAVYLQAYTLGGGAKVETVPQKYALVDLDGDGTNELVVYASPNYGAYLVFHVYRNKVYGFEFEEKALTQLKEDGTFVQNESAGISCYATLRFEKTKCTVVEQAYKNDILQNYANNEYRIGGEAVTFDTMYEFTQEFGNKATVRWTAYSDGTNGDYMAIYNAFLDNRQLAYEGWARKTLSSYIGTNTGYGISYTLYDMTGDGIPELCIDYSPSMHFFTVKNGQLHHWYTWTYEADSYFLNNGAFLNQMGSLSYGRMICDYYTLDPNAAIKFRITFSWYDQNDDNKQDSQDSYYVNGELVSKTEYDRVVEQYEDIGFSDIPWNYKYFGAT